MHQAEGQFALLSSQGRQHPWRGTGRRMACSVFLPVLEHPTAVDGSGPRSTTISETTMGAIMPAGHPWLLVTTAISADSRAYCSAVRMEPTRANLGGAAGIITALALKRGGPPDQLTYQEVRSELVRDGYEVN